MISFIVPAHNEQTMLPGCLASIRQAAGQGHLDHEVLVVSDASTDRTVEVAEEHHARVIAVQHRPFAATRNAGAQQAVGSVCPSRLGGVARSAHPLPVSER